MLVLLAVVTTCLIGQGCVQETAAATAALYCKMLPWIR